MPPSALAAWVPKCSATGARMVSGVGMGRGMVATLDQEITGVFDLWGYDRCHFHRVCSSGVMEVDIWSSSPCSCIPCLDDAVSDNT